MYVHFVLCHVYHVCHVYPCTCVEAACRTRDIDGRVWAQMAGVRSIYYASTGPHRTVSYKLQIICRLYK